MKKWYRSKKLWLAVLGQIPVILAVVLPLCFGLDKNLAATLSGSLGIMIEAVVIALIGSHAYVDGQATKAIIATEAARGTADPSPPGSGHA